ncbi:YceI family protein [Hufsiella ginkgonis]|uniref:YceI family protein n=1 Tax=Hufsiella ginkgonis TaxID=2695274 RepID=A0A7K1Y0K5_9SPHI|nr:YceI family protein [Hufsiella ginkgonis]MXV16732.1 YceI family protein [Hufsiella ginkgonis]
MNTLHYRPVNPVKRAAWLLIALMAGLIASTQQAAAQTAYVAAGGSQITVSGTSTLHDWSMQATSFDVQGNFLLKNGQVADLNSLAFTLPVSNLKSKESSMDSRAYKALNEKEFPKMTFKLKDATVSAQLHSIKATGTLTIAGVSKEVILEASYTVNGDETITCKLTEPIKMSDYGVKAPTMMMGTIKTGDALTIDIVLKLKKSTSIAQSNQ